MGDIYTDLAREAREINPDIAGVEEDFSEYGGTTVSRIKIVTSDAASALGKPKGRYITIEAPKLVMRDTAIFRAVSGILSHELSSLLPANASGVLVVGLGNRLITPDSLGPRVIEKTFITRHMTEHLPDIIGEPMRPVAAVAPGVLGTTGVETLEMLRGLVERVEPDVIIVIDALASRRAVRINTAIQLTDTGIHPGSGVGNKGRLGITPDSIGVPVVAIGVPTVVLSSTIIRDTVSLIAEETKFTHDQNRIFKLAESMVNEDIGPMIVTPKEIDTIIADMAGILSDAINLSLHKPYYEKIKELLA